MVMLTGRSTKMDEVVGLEVGADDYITKPFDSRILAARINAHLRRSALAESGATLADVLKTTVFVASADRADLVAAWDVVSVAFGEHDAPSTLLGVAVLGYADQLVEIEAVAVAPG